MSAGRETTDYRAAPDFQAELAKRRLTYECARGRLRDAQDALDVAEIEYGDAQRALKALVTIAREALNNGADPGDMGSRGSSNAEGNLASHPAKVSDASSAAKAVEPDGPTIQGMLIEELRDWTDGAIPSSRVQYRQQRERHTGYRAAAAIERLSAGLRRIASDTDEDDTFLAFRIAREALSETARAGSGPEGIQGEAGPVTGTESDCSTGAGGLTLAQMAENMKRGLDPYTGSEAIPAGPVPIPVTEIVRALEREAGNTDTSPQWQAAIALRHMANWESRTLICRVDGRSITCQEIR